MTAEQELLNKLEASTHYKQAIQLITQYGLQKQNEILDKAAEGNYEEFIPLSDLSPHSPVKPVDGWAVVGNANSILWATFHRHQDVCKTNCSNLFDDTWEELESMGYRCIEVTIIPKPTNND